MPNHLTCLLRNLYAGQEATVRTKTWNNGLVPNWKRSMSRCILSPCLFNLYAEYIMINAGLAEAQTGIKIARKKTSNHRCVDDTTPMAESEELKSLLMKVKEESEKVGLKLNIWKTQQWPQDWKSSVVIPILKRGNAKECSNYCTIALISHTVK